MKSQKNNPLKPGFDKQPGGMFDDPRDGVDGVDGMDGVWNKLPETLESCPIEALHDDCMMINLNEMRNWLGPRDIR